MKQLVRYILLIVSMVLIGHGDVSAASKFSDFQDSYASAAYQKDGQYASSDAIALEDGQYASEALPKKDGLAKVEHHDQQQEAQLENASSQAYRACSERPQRLLPSGNIHGGNQAASRLLLHRIRLLSTLLSALYGGMEPVRQESAPIHFDVASKYYVICLRRLLC